MNQRSLQTLLLIVVLAAILSCARAPRSDTSELGLPPSCRHSVPGRPAVEWIDVEEAYYRRATMKWCATVGPPVIEDFRVNTDSLTSDSLVIVSWNTYVGGGDIVDFVGRLRRGEFTSGEPLDHFVLLVQEAHRTGPDVPMDVPDITFPRRYAKIPPSGERIDIIEAAKRAQLNLFYVPSMRNGKPGQAETEEDKGNAVLTTLPISDLVAIELPLEKFRRVPIVVTVSGRTKTGSDWSLRVCNVHLDTRTRFPRYLSSMGEGRLYQAKALLNALPELPNVFAGDLNTWAFTRYMERVVPFLRQHFDQPVKLDDRPTLALPVLPDRRVDYMFFELPGDRRGTYRRLDDRMGSDHYPLLGCVDLIDQQTQ